MSTKAVRLLLSSLALTAALAWGDPSATTAPSAEQRAAGVPKLVVAVPEPSPWAEFAVCAVGLTLLARYLIRAQRT